MSKRGLPTGIKMRHDSHYVDEIARGNRTVGKIIAIDQIFPNPEQPRNEFGDLTELTSSIREQGVLEPLLVQPKNGKFMIIAGERRWRASGEAGLTELPCVVLEIDDHTVAEIALVENLQRKDLNIWEVADGLADLATRFGYTHDQIAQKIGKSRTSVTESLAIAGLPESIRSRCRDQKITAKSTLVEISRAFDESEMHELLDRVTTKKGPVVRKAVREEKSDSPTGNETPSKPASKEHAVFRYKSDDNDFELVVKHFDREEVSRTDLLRALKEAFDSIKAGN
ncbi:MAG: ParB/RepB/Spo0J family partition protein [Pyrinomonadaceae bacterium]